ncbi:hypothetical protein [Methylobacter tundripaludum]|jgi:hypothetical protein|uniref:Phage coat protein n=1 Tax=Methylobacter tundripaludum (strain ATCC BAA-1195 / DSM 17260 / SV96) TaxID=697282 RepID=G3J0D7_METTV|nr:hypothetical protein [Methylobacter tundripaludum]EGW20659.1 hypothetical protein Mettu_3808 [Methylobacter tundripaludum SV96]
MKNIKRIGAVLLTALALAMVAITPANAALDFTALTAAVDATTIVAALTAIAAIKMLPGVAKWGFNKVIGWFR